MHEMRRASRWTFFVSIYYTRLKCWYWWDVNQLKIRTIKLAKAKIETRSSFLVRRNAERERWRAQIANSGYFIREEVSLLRKMWSESKEYFRLYFEMTSSHQSIKPQLIGIFSCSLSSWRSNQSQTSIIPVVFTMIDHHTLYSHSVRS